MIFAIVCGAFFSVARATLYPTQLSSKALALSSECVSQIKACPPTSSVCASGICSICTGLGISPALEPCCDAPTPTNCFANNYIHGVTSTAATTPSASLASTIVAGSYACKSLFSIYDACEASTPGFLNSYFSDQQKCYCSTSGTFAPSRYDGYFSSCLSFASMYDPAEYSQLGPTGGADFTGTYTGIGISHGLGSKPCQAWNQYTKTTTPNPVHSSGPAAPPPQTTTRSQGGVPAVQVYEGKMQTIFVVIVTNVYLALRL